MATFVLVHGAWQGGWTWDRVVPLLREQGHEVYAPTLTGLGERAHLLSPQVTLETHVLDVIGVLEHHRLQHVVLVGHSYAGQVIATVASRASARIAGLIYLEAFLPDDGQTATEEQAEQIAHHYRESVQAAGFGWLIPTRSLEVLGVTEPGDVAWLSALMGPHPYRTFNEPASVSAESLQIPSAFIEGVDWLRVFKAQAQKARRRGWPVHELHGGHQLMTTMPRELAQLLEKITTDFQTES